MRAAIASAADVADGECGAAAADDGRGVNAGDGGPDDGGRGAAAADDGRGDTVGDGGLGAAAGTAIGLVLLQVRAILLALLCMRRELATDKDNESETWRPYCTNRSSAAKAAWCRFSCKPSLAIMRLALESGPLLSHVVALPAKLPRSVCGPVEVACMEIVPH